MMEKLLEGKTAVITGGTRGIGFATARTFLKNGAKVVIFGTREESVSKALKKLKEEDPNFEVYGMWPNIMDYNEAKKAVDSIVKNYGGKIDIWINNAGVSAKGSIFNCKPEDFDYVFKLNVNAVFYCTKAATAVMQKQGGGVILNTSSMVSLYGQASGPQYPASKFAVNGFTKSLARELGPYNIRVNAIAPGIIDTDMLRALPKELQERIAGAIPLHRLGSAQDVANAFLFLASDYASYISGAVISVDGAAVL